MKPRRSAGVYVPRDLIESPAFLSLGGKAPQVLMIFYTKRRVEKLRGAGPRGERFRILNNGQIVFTYREAKAKHGLGKSQFTRALDALVHHGFVDLAYTGGGLEGDCSKYAISERWRDWGTPRFKPAARPKGRPWATGATRKNARAPAPENARASDGAATENARGSAPKAAPHRARKQAHSIELPDGSSPHSAVAAPAVVCGPCR